ncbi:kinase-like domain-containing protein [Phaeosphaeriaceae sp. PMI808]|nr:kinase-like domain-containing protein [Phaeosphaeriaceae sp. PMI808]
MAAFLPPGINSTHIKGLGTTGVVAVIPNTNSRRVIKIPHPEPDAHARCEVEAEVYERLEQSRGGNSCSTILRYYGRGKYGIILEYAENGSLREYLRMARPTSNTLLLRWARQAAQALLSCHKSTILHGDINCSNLFLDGELNLKLGDFAGSSIDGSLATICYSTTHELPTSGSSSNIDGDDIIITKETEIFAFGSTLYEMVTGHPPFDDKSDSEVERLFRSREFPDVHSLPILGPLIKNCWNVEFSSMDEVLKSIEQFEGMRSLLLNIKKTLLRYTNADQLRPPHAKLRSLILSVQT